MKPFCILQSQTKIVLAKDYPFTGETGACKKDVKYVKC